MAGSIERVASLIAGNEPLRWIFAGDSITHGAKHTYGGRDYVEHFAERLRWELGRSRDHVIKTGISGWRINVLLDDIDWSLLQHRPDVVSINMGMNDCCQGDAGLATFRRDYEAVLDTVKTSTDAPLVLHTPNDVLPSAAERASNLPGYVQVVRELAKEREAVLVDHYAEWHAVQPDYWCSDAVHPSDIGHIVMANRLLKSLNLFDEKSEMCRLFVPKPEPKR